MAVGGETVQLLLEQSLTFQLDGESAGHATGLPRQPKPDVKVAKARYPAFDAGIVGSDLVDSSRGRKGRNPF